MQNIASFPTDEFPALLARLPADLDLDRLAGEHKAIRRGRKIKTGADLLRLALVAILLLIAFLVLHASLVPPGFGRYGHFRPASIDEIAA